MPIPARVVIPTHFTGTHGIDFNHEPAQELMPWPLSAQLGQIVRGSWPTTDRLGLLPGVEVEGARREGGMVMNV